MIWMKKNDAEELKKKEKKNFTRNIKFYLKKNIYSNHETKENTVEK